MAEKYIVFKRADVMTMVPADTALAFMECAAPIEDAVVIRKQDIFAGPALEVYSAAIRTAIKVMLPGEDKDRLLGIADYFHEAAEDAYQTDGKVPD